MDATGIGQAVSSVADFASGLVNHFLPETMTDGEKAQIQLKLQQAISQRESALIQAKKNIIVAELNQSDNYTKRARPTIIYGGLCFILLNYVIFPISTHFTGQSAPAINLPLEFWATWGGVCGVYVWGRTKEKQGLPGVIDTVKGLLR